MSKQRADNSTILLYCQDTALRKELENILKSYTLYSTSEVREAYRILDDAPPALILTDSKDIKSSDKREEIPVLFICQIHELRKTAMEIPLHIKDILTTPFIPNLVLRRIQNYLNHSVTAPAEQALYKLLFDLIPAYVFIKNREGRFLAVNNAVADALELTKDEIVGALHIEIQPGRKDVERMLKDDQKVFNSGKPLNISLEKFRDRTGNIHWLQATKVLCPPEAFGEDAIIGVSVDITHMREVEVKLEQRLKGKYFSEKMDAIGKISGRIAHDFNNILSGILSASELLQDVVQNNKALEYSVMIRESARKAADLNEKLLGFSIQESKSISPFEAHKALKDAIGSLGTSLDKRILIDWNLRAGHSRIQGNRKMLQNALHNLGLNAAYAMPRGGTLFVRTGNREINEEYCQDSRYQISPGKFLTIEIEDTGTGIDPEILPDIFDPFFTTKAAEGGTGLGLAEVYNSITQLEGAVEVRSTIGKGSCFTLLIPLSDEASPSIETPPPAKGGTILLVDDEPVLRKMLTELLEREGYTVIAAENGKEGLFQFRKHPNLFDLIIMDMIMPEMTGSVSYDAIKSMEPDIKVLFISGYFQDHILKEITESDRTGFIHKPFRGEQILKKVHEMLTTE